MKSKEEDQEKRAQVKKMKEIDLKTYNFIHPTSQPKPKNFLEAIFTKCLTLPNNLEKHINL
jgi:hypothetical protein